MGVLLGKYEILFKYDHLLEVFLMTNFIKFDHPLVDAEETGYLTILVGQ